jgi:hypothetical protein
MKEWEVKIPIAGHAIVLVEAENKEEAISKATSEVELKDIEYWEALKQFNTGNVCHCPTPWEAEAECVGEDE